jgi:molecular chaperone HtpG
MVAERVEIISRSWRDGEDAARWECDGSPEFSLEKAERTERGTDIVLHIHDDSAEFLESARVSSLLDKYCKFLPVAVWFEEKQINNTHPAWTRKPADLTQEDYDKFYEELYPFAEKPLFHIHLNVDYPFNLTGILYFPKLQRNFEVQKNKIQLYCNQVFVTDSVEGIVPDFLTMLHGVLDSPDIPLNVSRSYLQSDSNVKKISNHIPRKWPISSRNCLRTAARNTKASGTILKCLSNTACSATKSSTSVRRSSICLKTSMASITQPMNCRNN